MYCPRYDIDIIFGSVSNFCWTQLAYTAGVYRVKHNNYPCSSIQDDGNQHETVMFSVKS